jgi:hypothetical protein
MSSAQQELEQRIRERAYFLWLQNGRPEGHSDEFWERARMFELQADQKADDMRVDVEGEDSFPASDPPSHVGITGEGRNGR